jgi:hypothetical protein
MARLTFEFHGTAFEDKECAKRDRPVGAKTFEVDDSKLGGKGVSRINSKEE